MGCSYKMYIVLSIFRVGQQNCCGNILVVISVERCNIGNE
jgi:hypothetical protein